MNLLMVGSGGGSWTMRGQQLGGVLGARVVGTPSQDDLQWADLVVLVKRAAFDWAPLVHKAGKPIVWDALDFWQQPEQNGSTETAALGLLKAALTYVKPTLVIGATAAMARAVDGVYLPHHTWKGLTPAAARSTVRFVGYQGTRKYLGQWGRAVMDECHRRGWKFVLNPADLRECDLLVAFRDGPFDGWMCREWKSGVKLVNAMASGRPMITQDSAAWREIRPVGCTVQTQAELSRAFDLWGSHPMRQTAVDQDWARYALASVANTYQQVLSDVGKVAA